MNISIFSGRPAECQHHLIFGTSNRKLADIDGLIIPLTNDEHNMSSKGTIYQIHGNPAAERLSKIVGQLAWERKYFLDALDYATEEEGFSKNCAEEARKRFRQRYGKSFI